MHRCHHCHGRFGLVSHRYLFKRFCSKTCVGRYKRKLAVAIGERIVRLRSDLLTSIGLGDATHSMGARRAVPVRVRSAGTIRKPHQAEHLNRVTDHIMGRAMLFSGIVCAVAWIARVTVSLH